MIASAQWPQGTSGCHPGQLRKRLFSFSQEVLLGGAVVDCRGEFSEVWLRIFISFQIILVGLVVEAVCLLCCFVPGDAGATTLLYTMGHGRSCRTASGNVQCVMSPPPTFRDDHFPTGDRGLI